MGKARTTEQFIVDAKKVHGDIYDYSKVMYTRNDAKVILVCKTHGEFSINPTNHLRGYGCPTCGERPVRSTESFIKKSRVVHGNKYDYSRVVYTRALNKVEIVCPIHGSFLQTASSHTRGIGCPVCGGKFPYTTESYIVKAKEKHGNKYDYSIVEYKNTHTKVSIICPVHGIFLQLAGAHLQGVGCPKCAKNVPQTTEEFILRAKKVHGDKYTYEHTIYKNNHTKVIITCPKHGDFSILPPHFLKGIGCSLCCNSLGGNAVRAWLDNNKILYIPEYKNKECKDKRSLSFDFAIVDENNQVLGLIEYDGKQHFEPCSMFGNGKHFTTTILHDAIKNQFCEDNSIHLLRIPYWDKEKIPEKLEIFLKQIEG